MQNEIASQLEQLKDISQVEVKTPADFEQVAVALKQIKTLRKAAEDKRVELTKPLLDHKKKIDDEFKRYIDAYDRIISGINGKLVAYQQAEEKKRREEIARIEAERRAKEAELQAKLEKAKTEATKAKIENALVDVQFAPPPVIDAPKAQGLSFREVYGFKVVDANAIPREWLVPNEQAISAFIRSTKGTVKIAGIEIEITKTAVSR